MPLFPKINGSHKEMTDCKVKVGGKIKQGVEMLTKVNGKWKEVWVDNYIDRDISFETASYSKVDKYYPTVPSTSLVKDFHAQAFNKSGELVAEVKETRETTNGFQKTLYNNLNQSLGYVDISIYPAEGLIRYTVSIDDTSVTSKMTLSIKSITPVE